MKRKKKKYYYLYIVIATVFLLLGIYKYCYKYFNSDIELNGPFYVSYVIDGDTFIIDNNSKQEKIRVMGIDAPEASSNEEWMVSTNRAKELLEHKYVYLEYDENKYDNYGRTLAYVYFDNKERFEDLMLKEGLARTLILEPNIKYEKEFIMLEQEAKNTIVGFWKTGFYK